MSPARVGAVAGVGYVVLDIVVGVMAGAPPGPSASEREITAYISDHRVGIGVGLWLFGLAIVGLLWWFGELWSRLADAERGKPRLAIVSLAGLVLGGTMALASAVVMATLALGDQPESVVTLYALAAVLLATSGFGLGTHLLATNVIAARAHLFSAWLVVCGLVSAVGFLVAAVLGAIDDGPLPNSVSLVGFVLWLAWIVGVSHRMWRDDPSTLPAVGVSTVAP